MPKEIFYCDKRIYCFDDKTKKIRYMDFDDLAFQPIEVKDCSKDVLEILVSLLIKKE